MSNLNIFFFQNENNNIEICKNKIIRIFLVLKTMITVIMPNYNHGKFIKNAIQSCLKNNYLKEIIIADGGSNDNSLSEISKLMQFDSRITYIESKDSGPAEALNKALNKSSGEYIGWLNSDDLYNINIFNKIISEFEKDENLKIVYGNGANVSENGSFKNFYPTFKPFEGINQFLDGCFICQPTVFCKRQLLIDIGGFNNECKTCFDLDLWLRIFTKLEISEIGFIDELLAFTRIHEKTITSNSQFLVNLESAILLKKFLGKVPDHWCATAAKNAIIKYDSKALNELSILSKERYIPIEIVDRIKYFIEQYQLDISKELNGNDIVRNSLPSSLRVLLSSRYDLISEGLHKIENERLLCQWIILHGFKEYPYLKIGNNSSNSLLNWLSETPISGSLPRVMQAIWDTKKKHRRLWPSSEDTKSYQKWLKNNWSKIKEVDLLYESFFGTGFIKSYFLKIKKNFYDNYLFKKQSSFSNGVNVVGYVSFSLGIGEDCRSTFNALRSVGINTNLIDFSPNNLKNRANNILSYAISEKASFKVSIICLTPEEFMRYFLNDCSNALKDSYIIGYWPWELPRWPKNWELANELVNEIWVSSKFIYDSIIQTTKKPVKIMPLCVDELKGLEPLSSEERNNIRHKYNLNIENIIFVFCFDLNSYLQRKNPWGSIDAFLKAFPPFPKNQINYNVNLIIKTFPPESENKDWDRLKQISELDERIIILENNLKRDDLLKFYGCCDVFLSLHRSEGFGRSLAESFQLGLDVISIKWSGNKDFCSGPLFHEVPYEIVSVPPGAYPHWPKQKWAEPNIDEASLVLKKVANQRKDKRKKIYDYSKEYQNQFSKYKCGQNYARRLKELNLLNED